MSQGAARVSWLLLGSLTALGPLAMGVHVPALTPIAAGIGETASNTQLSVPVFIVALGLGMFGAGAIQDRVGLRISSVVGLLIFVLGAVLTGTAASLWSLLVGRALVGFGAAFSIMAPRVAVASHSAEITADLARLAAIQSAAPALAPLLGAAILTWLDWRWTFLVPGAKAAVLLVPAAHSLPQRRQPTEDVPAMSAASFAWIGSPGWLLPAVEIALVTLVFLVFLAQTSNLLVAPLGLNPSGVGFVLALTGVAFVAGSLALVRTRNAPRLQRASRLAFLGAMVLLVIGGSSLLLWTVGLIVYALANGVLIPSAFGAITRAVSGSTGQALGAASALQMLVGAAGGAAANAVGGLTPVTFGLTGAAIALVVLALSSTNAGRVQPT